MIQNPDIRYLNETVWCKLGPSPIHGIGVFAIRDIPKGQELTDYFLEYSLQNKHYDPLIVNVEDFDLILPEIRALILDRITLDKTKERKWIRFQSPNKDQLLQAFMNHSDTPNSDGEFALRDIKKGEELTEDFRDLAVELHPLTKKHYHFL